MQRFLLPSLSMQRLLFPSLSIQRFLFPSLMQQFLLPSLRLRHLCMQGVASSGDALDSLTAIAGRLGGGL